MTTTMTARGTRLNASTTQNMNTAPVHEHYCMFSRDGHKNFKNRKWHDGSLKFHTFNSRVMVYDLDRHFVGDLHYRDEEEFGEGLELTLDRGPMVQVGHRLGETQTDLGEVLNGKSREDGAGSSPAALKPSRLPSIISQGKPRSLKEVLGASQGPIGRARISYKSPYEQGHALTDIQPAEPPAKRQKTTSLGKENASLTVTKHLEPQITIASPPKTKVPQAKPKEKSTQFPVPVPKPSKKATPNPGKAISDKVTDSQEILDLASSDDEVAVTPKPPISKPKPKATKAKPQNKQKMQDQMHRSPRLSPASKVVEIPGPVSRPDRHAQINASVRRGSVSSIGSIRSDGAVLSWNARSQLLKPGAGSGSAKLSMQPQKARPKLMYRALLPASKPLTKLPSPSVRRNDLNQRREDSPVDSAGPPSPEVGSQDIDQEQDIFGQDQQEPAIPIEAPDEQEKDLVAPTHIPPDNPLFLPSVGVPSSPVPARPASQDSLGDLMCVPSSEPEIIEDATRQAKAMSEHEESFPIVNDSFEDLPPAEAKLRTDRENDTFPVPEQRNPAAVLMPPPPLVPAMPPPAKVFVSPRDRSLKRALSESDATFTQEVPDDAWLGLKTQARPPPRRMSAQGSPSELRRATSDPNIVAQCASVSIGMVVPDQEASETGPWTSKEAFLLFDIWPSAKIKPDYGPMPQMDIGRCGPPLQGIMTARDMLRDDMNVL